MGFFVHILVRGSFFFSLWFVLHDPSEKLLFSRRTCTTIVSTMCLKMFQHNVGFSFLLSKNKTIPLQANIWHSRKSSILLAGQSAV